MSKQSNKKTSKLKVFKKAIPILIAGTIVVYAGAKVGQMKSKNDHSKDKYIATDIEANQNEVIEESINQEQVEDLQKNENNIQEIENIEEPKVEEEKKEVPVKSQQTTKPVEQKTETPKTDQKKQTTSQKTQGQTTNQKSQTTTKKNDDTPSVTIDVNYKPQQNIIESEEPSTTVSTNQQSKQEQPVKNESVSTNDFGLTIEKKQMVVATTGVNIRKTPSTDGDKLGLLSNGSSLEYVSKENEKWYKVKYKGNDAYISADYSKLKEQTKIKDSVQKMVYFTKNSNMYNDTNKASVKTSVPYLEAAAVYKDAGNFYVASIYNNIGYIQKSDVQELTGNYVIVDLSDQTAALYNGANKVLETPVVTGKPATPTTKGLHSIHHISSDRYLVGEDYKAYVDVFMAFHNGEGLHDAEYHTDYDSNGNKTMSHGWRNYNSFGGELYKTNGSHGCVNMRHDDAMTMYKTLKLKDKVLVKE